MKPIRILVDSFADAGLPNAQMGNAREIVSRLDPEMFHVSMFVLNDPDSRLAKRKNTRLIQLQRTKQTPRILAEFLWGTHKLLFYMKASPASGFYSGWRKRWKDRRTTIGTIESQSNVKDEPTITPKGVGLWERTVLRCDHLFSNSLSVKDSLAREYGLASEVIPTGVDTKFFSPDWYRPPNPKPRILFAGSLRPFKQPQFLLAAAARFPHADFRIAGEGMLRAQLEARIRKEDLQNVTLLGMLAAEELREEYRQADVFLFPSAWEGSPKVVLEAAACGLPVIVRNAYSAETVVHEITGFQATCDNELYSSLQCLLSNAERRRKMGEAGRLHAQKYDWDVISSQWSETFKRLAGEIELRHAS